MVAANLWGIPLGMFYVYKGLRKTSAMQLPALHVLVLAVCACVLANTLVLPQKVFLLGWDGAAGEKGSRAQLGLGGSGGTGLMVQEQRAWRKAEGWGQFGGVRGQCEGCEVSLQGCSRDAVLALL